MLQTKEQLQKIAIGAILAGGALFALVYFVISPRIAEWKANKAQAKEILAKLDDQRVTIRKRPEIQQQLEDVQAQIRIADALLPRPKLGNYLLVLEEHLQSCARDMNIKIISVAESDIIWPASGQFKIYRIRVAAQAGYTDMVKLFNKIETSNPFVSISGVMLVPRKEDPERHDLNFLVAWVIWADRSKRPAFLLESEKNIANE